MNDNKLSAERNSTSELSMTVMGKVVLLKPQTLPERSESVMRHKAYCTEEKCDIAAPFTRIIKLFRYAGLKRNDRVYCIYNNDLEVHSYVENT